MRFVKGDILKEGVEALVNSVNTKGVMGKGVALAFKKAFPENFKVYEQACKEGLVVTGKMFITATEALYPKYIINFPTKDHWRNPSKLEYIDKGLDDLISVIHQYNIKSIAIPPLGAGNGKLEWEVVKNLISKKLAAVEEFCDIIVFEPGFSLPQVDVAKVPSLTSVRAMLLFLMDKYKMFDYELNLLVVQKLAYFLQRFGEPMRLEFEKGWYGPYANSLNKVLANLNGYYISVNTENTKPETPVFLCSENQWQVTSYVENVISQEQRLRLKKVLDFVEGFESPYGLELLATVDYIITKNPDYQADDILNNISDWTNRKRSLMKPHHINVAIARLKEYSSDLV